MTHIYTVVSRYELMTALKVIAGRYYCSGAVRHHPDCMIYRSVEVYGHCFCSCGLLHDLNQIHHLAEVLYPNFFADNWLQDHQEVYKPEDPKQQEGQEEAERILYEAFGAPEVPDLRDLKEDYDIDKDAIIEHFGKNTAILKNLDEKLKKDMEGRWKFEKYRK